MQLSEKEARENLSLLCESELLIECERMGISIFDLKKCVLHNNITLKQILIDILIITYNEMEV